MSAAQLWRSLPRCAQRYEHSSKNFDPTLRILIHVLVMTVDSSSDCNQPSRMFQFEDDASDSGVFCGLFRSVRNMNFRSPRLTKSNVFSLYRFELSLD